MKTIACPHCGFENDFDSTCQDIIACENCGEIIVIPEELYT